MDISKLTIKEARKLLAAREIGTVELTREYLARIDSLDNTLGAYITVCGEEALKQADNAQRLIDAGEGGNLCGIPLSIKDNICMKGIRTTCASKTLENYVPQYSATAVKKLVDAGAVILGKTNMDEFAMGSSTETSYFGKTSNPYDTSRVPGGSSGGSAVSVAASLAMGSLGSDTGGSVRQPAAFCGVVGMKPTYGLVSRNGLVAFASSLDQIGPIAGNVEDCAALLEVIAGSDRYDATSVDAPVTDYTSFVGRDIKGLRVGLPLEYMSEGLNPEVREAVMNSITTLKTMGAAVETFSMPCLKYAVPAYYLISSAEASSNLSRYDGIKYGHRAADCKSYKELLGKSRAEGFGREVKRRILLGTYALASGYYDAYYKKALKLRTMIRDGYKKAFEKYDIIVNPTTPTTAYRLGENIDNPRAMYLADIYTVAANIAGLPSISIPCGYDTGRLPIGVSFTGRVFGEPDIIKAASALEASFAGSRRSPVLKEGGED